LQYGNKIKPTADCRGNLEKKEKVVMANANDFFDGLGETLVRTAKELGERAGHVYETQKIRNNISEEERKAGKLQEEIGRIIYKKYRRGEEISPEILALCEQIQEHLRKAASYKDEVAALKGQKICPSCQKAIDKTVSFCPHCGTACPTTEKEKKTEDVADSEGIDPEGKDEKTAEDTEDQSKEKASCDNEESAPGQKDNGQEDDGKESSGELEPKESENVEEEQGEVTN
jgi:hypothetical protein